MPIDIKSHAVQPGLTPVQGIKNIIAVASGKGGVGKSTVTVNLALALKQLGVRVGILDADIYGPSQPRMLGAFAKPADTTADNKILPVVSHDIPSMSIGYLLEGVTPTIWRGPMVSQALQQLLQQTVWGELDILLIDMPPGTGDIQLTLAQKVPVAGAVIVTTPQDIAVLDARKGLEMFNKVHVSVLGVVENMATHLCTACGHAEAIFGEQGGERLAEATQVRFLGRLPLSARIQKETDQGTPTVVLAPDSPEAKLFVDMAKALLDELAKRPKNLTARMPKVVVERRM